MRIGALEAGGTKMVVAIGNEKGEILKRESIPTETPEVTMPKLVQYFKENNIEALGIGGFGPIDLSKSSKTYGYILDTPKLAWRNYNFLGAFKKALNIPIGLDTDVNAAAIGEATWGSTKEVDSSVYVTVGTGIGMGVIVEGKPLHGMLHPECGHMLVARHNEDDYEGKCPSHAQCLEGFAAGPAIEERWGKKAYDLKDCTKVWDMEAYYIAQGLVNVILTLSPKKIVLGGGVMHQTQLYPLIRLKVLELLNGYIKTPELNDIENYIVAPALNDNQGIMGCLKLGLMEVKQN